MAEFNYGLLNGETDLVMDNAGSSELFKYFFRTENKFIRGEAERLFFINDSRFLGGVKETKLNGCDGIPEDTLIGKWTYHDHIYVRAGKTNGLAILVDYNILVDVRTDRAEKAFFRGINSGSGVNLENMNKYLPQINSIVRAVEGYESIVAARRFGKKEE